MVLSSGLELPPSSLTCRFYLFGVRKPACAFYTSSLVGMASPQATALQGRNVGAGITPALRYASATPARRCQRRPRLRRKKLATRNSPLVTKTSSYLFSVFCSLFSANRSIPSFPLPLQSQFPIFNGFFSGLMSLSREASGCIL